MKVFASLLLLFILVMISVDAHIPPVWKPQPNKPGFLTSPERKHLKPKSYLPRYPTFPGPYVRPIRFRRSLEEEPSKIHISGGIKKQPGKKPEVQISGSIGKG